VFNRVFLCVTALTILIALAPAAEAGDITSIGPVSGPGGTGSAVIDSQTSSAADVTLDFTSAAPLFVPVVVDDAGGYLIHTSAGSGPSLGIINDTGVPWTNFLFQVSGPPGTGPNAIEFGSPTYFTSSGPSPPGDIYMSGGTVPVGATFNVTLGFGTSQAADVLLTYTPNAVIPEPSSLVLLGLAVVGIPVVFRRRIRARGAADSITRP
jgi:hypothetical protein